MNLLFSLPQLIFCRINTKSERFGRFKIISHDGEAKKSLTNIKEELSAFLADNFGIQKSLYLPKSSEEWIVKVYPPKKGIDRILHLLLPSKAFWEYCMALKLSSLNISVPKPLAAVERRIFPGATLSLFILEYLKDCKRANEVFSELTGKERLEFLKRLAYFVKRLHSTCFCHSDLWTKNILVRGDREFFIVDLDGCYFNCWLLPLRAPVNLAQLLYSLNRSSPLSSEDIKFFLKCYGASRQLLRRIIKAYKRKFHLWPWTEMCHLPAWNTGSADGKGNQLNSRL